MSIYIIRPKTTSIARSLNLASRKFTLESRKSQTAEVAAFWQEDPVHKDIENWLEDAAEISRYPTYSGITGASIVEMSDEEAVEMQRDLPNALIIQDQPIALIQPERNVAGAKDKLTTNDLWHLEAIALNLARQEGFTGTGKNVTIAVLDTGIDSNHPELQGRVVESHSFNNRTKQIQSIPSQDTYGHGTHVAGLICGQQVGIAPEAKLINGAMLPKGIFTLSELILWLDWLGNRPDVSIVNISAGIPVYDPQISDWIDDLRSVGILPICAIGNDGFNNHVTPANCKNSLSVGATNLNNQIASFSGNARITVNNQLYNVPYLVAPGEGVYSSVIGGNYEAWSGTSMATPIVSGVAALILEKYDNKITVEGLIDSLLSNCKDLGLDKERQGKGLVQVTAAL